MRIQYYDGEYSKDTNLGRNFYTYPWEHEIPYFVNLNHTGSKTWHSFDLYTIFSGNVFSEVGNNLFMLFLMFWCSGKVGKGMERTIKGDVLNEIALKLRDKMAV